MSRVSDIQSIDATQRAVAPEDLRITLWSDLEDEASAGWDQFCQRLTRTVRCSIVSNSATLRCVFAWPSAVPPRRRRPRLQESFSGILPLFRVKSLLFGRMLISTPQAAYGGILARSPAVTAAIFDRARSLAQEADVRFLELRSFRVAQTEPSLVTRDLYVTFRQELFADPERNMAVIPRKTRAEIREGIRHGLEFAVDRIMGQMTSFLRVLAQRSRTRHPCVFEATLVEWPARIRTELQDLFGALERHSRRGPCGPCSIVTRSFPTTADHRETTACL